MSETDLAELLASFERVCPPSPFGIPYHAQFAGSGRRKEHLLIGFITHGNERGTLPAAVRLAKELASGAIKPAGPVSLLLGNVAACERDVRFVEEDFNRVFTFDRPADSLERRRAEEVRPLLDDVDFFLDIHQTQTPTESSFWTFPWIDDLGKWARVIGAAPLGLTRKNQGAFSVGRCCLDEYVRARGKLGLTAEMGEKGWDETQAEETYQSCARLISAYDAVMTGASDLDSLACESNEIEWFETRDVVPAESSDHRLREGVGNWQSVREGELLSPPGGPEIRAKESGRILFPKYAKPGDPPPPELFRLGVAIDDPARTFSGG